MKETSLVSIKASGRSSVASRMMMAVVDLDRMTVMLLYRGVLGRPSSIGKLLGLSALRRPVVAAALAKLCIRLFLRLCLPIRCNLDQMNA